ncbi:MAG: arginase family protein [Chloroflexota bacterium]
MQNQYILTPFVLDKPRPGLEPFRQADWQMIKPILPEGTTEERMLALFRPLVSHVAEAVAAGKRPIAINGDCCAAIGVLAGLQQAGVDPTLIWLDAHADYNTWETTPSGFLGGMPLAMMVGLGDMTLVNGTGMTHINPERIIASDFRSLDPPEVAALQNSPMTILYNMTELLTYPLPDKPLWVHFDTDVMDANDLKASNYPEPHGPSLETFRQLFRRLADTGRLIAISVSSWNPDLDQQDRAGKLIMELVAELAAG